MESRARLTAKEYYSDPYLKNLLNAVFAKYRSYGRGRGRIELQITNQAEARRLQAFFGPRIRGVLRAGSILNIEVKEIEEEIGKHFLLTIPSLYEMLYQEPLLTKKESAVKADLEWESFFINTIELFRKKEDINIVNREFCDLTHDWLYRLWKKDKSSGYRILQSGIKNHSSAIEEFMICMTALWLLFMRRDYLKQEQKSSQLYIQFLATEVIKDPHALDNKKRLAGRLFFRALEDINFEQLAVAGKDDLLEHTPSFMRSRMIYRSFGLYDDSISSFFHKFTLDVYETMKKETINLNNLEAMNELSVNSNLFLIENPSVFLYMVDCLMDYINSNNISHELVRNEYPMLICTSGCFRAAVLEFARKCIEQNSKCRIYFSADFDRAGIEMLEKLKEYFPKNVSPFQMNAKTYLSGLDGKCRDLSERDREILAGKNNELAKLIAFHGKKVFQESVANDLWEVLEREIQCVETIMNQKYGGGINVMESRKVEMFLSYCWQDEKVAADIYTYINNIDNVNIYKDTIKIEKWGSIKDYMQTIENMDFIVLLISDAYLKSRNCMYEVLEVMRAHKYQNKIFPAVITKDIYNSKIIAGYVKYWQDEKRDLEASLRELDIQNLGELNYDLKIIQEIASNIAYFLKLVGEMNNPEIEEVQIEIKKKLYEMGLINS